MSRADQLADRFTFRLDEDDRERLDDLASELGYNSTGACVREELLDRATEVLGDE